jgi:hypothetical protein
MLFESDMSVAWLLPFLCVCENLIRLAGVVVALKSGQLRLHNFWQKASHGRVPRMEWHIHMVGYGQKKMKSRLCGHSMTFQGNFNPEKNHQALSIQGWHFVNTHQIAHIPSIGRPIRFQQRPQHPRPAREPPVWNSFWRDLPRPCTARCVPRAGALELRCSLHVGMMGRVDLGHGKFPLSQSIPSFYIKFRVLPWAKRTDVQNLAGFPLGKWFTNI